jgi:hypothetical protein
VSNLNDFFAQAARIGAAIGEASRLTLASLLFRLRRPTAAGSQPGPDASAPAASALSAAGAAAVAEPVENAGDAAGPAAAADDTLPQTESEQREAIDVSGPVMLGSPTADRTRFRLRLRFDDGSEGDEPASFVRRLFALLVVSEPDDVGLSEIQMQLAATVAARESGTDERVLRELFLPGQVFHLRPNESASETEPAWVISRASRRYDLRGSVRRALLMTSLGRSRRSLFRSLR